MSTTTQAVTSTPTPGFAKRKARALIGWMSEQEGASWIGGRQIGQAVDPAHISTCKQARAAVASRPDGVDQTDLLQALPPVLNDHIAALKADAKSAQVLAEAGDPHIVDLSRVCAAQPTIYTEAALSRVSGLMPTDALAIARVTLPLPTTSQVPVSFDNARNSWLLSSPNPNLRVAGHFNGPVAPGLIGYGFIVSLQNSYLQVSCLNGRYFLRDGYHRAYGLLAAGITNAAALVKEFASFEEVGLPTGLLPPTTYLGNKPPLLTDYLNDAVAVDTFLAVTTKMVVVQALELNSVA